MTGHSAFARNRCVILKGRWLNKPWRTCWNQSALDPSVWTIIQNGQKPMIRLVIQMSCKDAFNHGQFFLYYDDLMKSNITGSLRVESIVSNGIPLTSVNMRGFSVFFVDGPNKQPNKQLRWLWFDMQWTSCDTTVNVRPGHNCSLSNPPELTTRK